MYFRVGGPHIGKADTALEVNSDNVLIDHTWVWRGDHGVEGFTDTDTERWNTNTGRYGAVINGDNVTATGLFVEHFQRYNTVWNGEHGTDDPLPERAAVRPADAGRLDERRRRGLRRLQGRRPGAHPHASTAPGVYVFNQNNPSIHTENGFEVPRAPGRAGCTTS